jgi:hypothetical protein
MTRRSGPTRVEDRYPGASDWTIAAVQERYKRYCRQLRIRPRDLEPRYHNPVATWLGHIMSRIVDGIRDGDQACVMLAIELVEEDRGIPFGKLVKSDAARALRQHAHLDDIQQARLRRRFTDMLVRGYLPREYKEYAKLFRKIGLGIHRETIEKADQSNPFIRRWCWYLLQDHAAPRPTLPRLHKW